MFTLRRWWDRHGIQVVITGVALGGAWLLQQTQGAALLEIYQLLSRPFQPSQTQIEKLTNARVLELQERLVELENQNQKLKGLLDYSGKEKQKSKPIFAPIVGRSADHWWQQVTLGRGTNHGIKEGYIVTAPGGLVGRIDSVTPNTSRVLLLSDTTSQTGVTISRTRFMGFMRGQGSNRAIMQFFDKVPDVRKGDPVSTSPVSELFSPGIPVGKIVSLNLDKSPAPEAVVELTAPISSLEWVSVYPK